jgi:hypothetical protein
MFLTWTLGRVTSPLIGRMLHPGHEWQRNPWTEGLPGLEPARRFAPWISGRNAAPCGPGRGPAPPTYPTFASRTMSRYSLFAPTHVCSVMLGFDCAANANPPLSGVVTFHQMTL